MDEERQKLIIELTLLRKKFDKEMKPDWFYTDELADFILQDRKRVVEPLLKVWNRGAQGSTHNDMRIQRNLCIRVIGETLSNAGVAQ